jgi:hypothetical protein
MRLFTRKNAVSAETSQEVETLHKAKAFRIELGWRGMFSLILVCFCLFFWMFVLGIWAGQTILFPQRDSRMGPANAVQQSPPARIAEQADPAR